MIDRLCFALLYLSIYPFKSHWFALSKCQLCFDWLSSKEKFDSRLFSPKLGWSTVKKTESFLQYFSHCLRSLLTFCLCISSSWKSTPLQSRGRMMGREGIDRFLDFFQSHRGNEMNEWMNYYNSNALIDCVSLKKSFISTWFAFVGEFLKTAIDLLEQKDNNDHRRQFRLGCWIVYRISLSNKNQKKNSGWGISHCLLIFPLIS